ncbi:unnamed protein product [Cylicocyclus nassatus]|uniref:Apple domain-containing protein n=1 Tax=Cylicocyclus nassatus TaxID=53992 RepID=A0AA36GNN3_CYLNA|nr:unnamed protein product [Cylicocyclus nassatus]
MRFLQAKLEWVRIAFFYALINNSLHCTFKSVTSNFTASLKATFKGITEIECMSKCSADMECTFLDYNQETCRTFKHGNEVQELNSVNKAFAYSFDENESSCPTKVVSKPKPTIKTKVCNDYVVTSKNEKIILAKTDLTEAPDKIRKYDIPQFLTSESIGCKVAHLKRYLTGSVCADYHEKAPYAVAEYKCKEEARYVTVIDDKGGKNLEFSDFGDLERVESTPIFYVDAWWSSL